MAVSNMEDVMPAEAQALTVRHYRDVQSNVPCGVRRIKGILSTRKEGRVTCSKCMEKIREARAKRCQEGWRAFREDPDAWSKEQSLRDDWDQALGDGLEKA